MTFHYYQVGGSVPLDSPTYIYRQADEDLYRGLKAGEFCYVLNSRQMGKSSLRVRTMQRLQAEGIACASIDLMRIGSKDITPDRWYLSFLSQLANIFSLSISPRSKLKAWWQELEGFSPLHRFEAFLEEELLVEIDDRPIVIFIDEIDSILRLNFSCDDFFGFICSCYNRRAENQAYRRLTFSFLGVATPYDLICDHQNQSFNIGRAIELTGFQKHEITPLFQGLQGKAIQPNVVLSAVLDWTGGQPFLTQKLCKLIQSYPLPISAGMEADIVANIVRSNILENWESQDEPTHLKHIRDRLTFANKPYLLKLYRQILQRGEIPADNKLESLELQLSGAVVKQDGKLRIYNRIYAEIFNLDWVAEVSESDDKPLFTLNDPDLQWIEREVTAPLISQPPIFAIESESIDDRKIDDEQLIYDHWIYWVDRELPSQTIERFRQLFIIGANYPDQNIEKALYKLVLFVDGTSNFKNLIYRCCMIIINHWFSQRKRSAIVELVRILEEENSPQKIVNSLSGCAARVQELSASFIHSEEFKQLKRWAAIQGKRDDQSFSQKKPLIQLIDRYPYLDPDALISQNSSIEERQVLCKLLQKRQRKFEANLFRYAKYLFNDKTPVILQPNPTLLREDKLAKALQEFMGKVENSSNYKAISRQFLSQLKSRASSYKEFKSQLYEYLISNIDPRYGKHHFYQKLDRQLSQILPESNDRPLTKILVMQTCHQLFEFLVASPTDLKNFQLFIDLTGNLGITKTMGLLLKISLLSHGIDPQSISNLEKRFSILFKHYENDSIEERAWLIETLENLNVALATNFSKIDISVF
ncbi:MAG TPA: AAA-like domain-containing protein [Oscillatoriales cyanobacterium M59_W2019_021]|nr:AAA-like domain-containing protein [Oscillatoriales cyanobacterium M4454_W2019_049]HIK51948.1 AAA-like domain-containing protein [Oscillatoriales cyanobacterium M59_W2019_021]